VFLHILGDALGSVAVLLAGLIIAYAPGQYRFLADPICTLLITVFIMYTSIPLVRHASMLLLQPVPTSIQLGELRSSLLAVKHVLQVHELHVYSLTARQNVGSVHVILYDDVDFMKVLEH
jgi:zinc transporter 1